MKKVTQCRECGLCEPNISIGMIEGQEPIFNHCKQFGVEVEVDDGCTFGYPKESGEE